MKRVLVAAAIAALVTAGVAGAYFTGQAQVPDNVVQVGRVSVSTEPTSSAVSIENLAPGSTVTRAITVVNDGSLPVSVVVTAAKKAGITDLYNALTCRATADGRLVYEGPLASLLTTAVPVTSGDRCPMKFSIGLPPEAGNDLMGDYAKLTLYVDAEQLHP